MSGAGLLALVFAAAGCGGGGGGGNGTTKPLGGSNNTSVCAFTKRTGRGHVYVELSVSPTSLTPAACSAFSRSFGGRKLGGSAPNLPPGTGPPHCDFNKIGSTYKLELGVFSSPHTGTGRAFCRSFHPGQGFKRVPLG